MLYLVSLGFGVGLKKGLLVQKILFVFGMIFSNRRYELTLLAVAST